jgi:hypothetical protein
MVAPKTTSGTPTGNVTAAALITPRSSHYDKQLQLPFQFPVDYTCRFVGGKWKHNINLMCYDYEILSISLSLSLSLPPFPHSLTINTDSANPTEATMTCTINRGVGTGPADPAAAGPMFPILMIQPKALSAIFVVKFS